jgi:hypothetical protein
MQDQPTTGLRLVRSLFAEHGLTVPVVYVHRDAGTVDGMTADDLRDNLAAADLLLNVGGVCWLTEFDLCRRRALIDMDPLFTQVERFAAKILNDYHVHFSYGANIGRAGCTVPTAGVCWQSAVPPVVPELWPHPRAVPDHAPFTTVANWSSYGILTVDGEEYGQKDREFLRLINLPSKTRQSLELAVSSIEPAVTEQLRTAGWTIRFAGDFSHEVVAYRDYLLASRGEFSAAKHAYVKSRCGWFSDRTVCYLAAGLPAVLQDTGFSDWLPTGRGVLAFSTSEEACDCLEQVNADYAAHRRAAHEIAERVFDYRVVLPALLSRSGVN